VAIAAQYRLVITRHAWAAWCWVTAVMYVRTLALMSLVADPAPPLLPQPESESAPTTAAAPMRRKKPERTAAKRSEVITAIPRRDDMSTHVLPRARLAAVVAADGFGSGSAHAMPRSTSMSTSTSA
jgi:hypothetical protein